jgi:hypothetical protein
MKYIWEEIVLERQAQFLCEHLSDIFVGIVVTHDALTLVFPSRLLEHEHETRLRAICRTNECLVPMCQCLNVTLVGIKAPLK